MRYHAWFILASALPVVAFGMLRWHSGIIGLLRFVGTVVRGSLQLVSAVDMKRGRLCHDETHN
jgi:hypothetical protein